MVDGFGMQLLIAVAQLILGLVLSMGSVYISLRMFDKFTGKLDEWKEMKKGNVAVGILLGAIVISIALIIESGVTGITRPIIPGADFTMALIGLTIGLFNLLMSVLAAVVSVYIAIRVLDWITVDIDEMAELKKGNTAVAIMMGAVLLAVSFVIRGAVAGIIQVMNAVEILKLLGL